MYSVNLKVIRIDNRKKAREKALSEYNTIDLILTQNYTECMIQLMK